MVVVGEDCAVPGDKVGVAGAGAGGNHPRSQVQAGGLSGCPLPDVARAARLAADSIATMGVALSTAATTRLLQAERIKAGEIEVGLGIHERLAPTRAIGHAQGGGGDAGTSTTPTCNLKTAYRMLVVNSLGATPPGSWPWWPARRWRGSWPRARASSA